MIIGVFLIITFANSLTVNVPKHKKEKTSHEEHKKSSSFVVSSSTFSSFSLDGDKPEAHIKSMKTEEYREKEGDRPEEVRKYGELFVKDNDKPALLRKKANTNVEKEKTILNIHPEERKKLDKKEERLFLDKLSLNFDKFFKNDFSLFGVPALDNFDKQFESLGESLTKRKHGNYDKYLEGDAKQLIEQAKKMDNRKKAKK